MKYPEGTKFEAHPEVDFQETAYVSIIGFSSSFDEESLTPDASYRWRAFNAEGETINTGHRDAEKFDEWVERHATEIDEFPFEE